MNLDDLYYETLFTNGTVPELKEQMQAHLKANDLTMACAIQGRIDELNK